MNDDTLIAALQEIKQSIKGLEMKISNPISQEFVTIDQLCDALEVSRMTIYRYTKSGALKSYRFGAKTLYKVDEVRNAFKEL